MAVVTIGRYKCHDLTATQQGWVQDVVNGLTWNFSLLAGDIEVYAVSGKTLGKINVNGVLKQVWGSTVRSGRRINIFRGLTANDFRYAVAHETAHMVDADKLHAAAQNTLAHTYMLPKIPASQSWREGSYTDKPSESFAHQWAVNLYGAGTSWQNVNSGGKPNKNGLYRHYFASSDFTAVKNIVQTGSGNGDPDDPGDNFPGFWESPVLKDTALRKGVGGTTAKQGAGAEKHLPLGWIGGDKLPDYVYTALVQFDITWPAAADIESIDSAYLELTITADPTTHISASGEKSVLLASRVTDTWPEGSHGEGAWNAADWTNPAKNSTLRNLGPVGYEVAGTRKQFDVMDFVQDWAPARIKVGTLGAGKNLPNNGMWLRMSNQDKLIGATEFASSENDNTEYRPILYITYTAKSLPPVATPIAPLGNIPTTLFEFEGAYDDPMGTDEFGAYELEVRKAGAAYVWQPGVRQADANSSFSELFIRQSDEAPNRWQVGQAYEWRFQVQSKSNGKWSGFTDWQAFTVTAAAPTVTAQNLGSKATLDQVYFGGPFVDPEGVVTTGKAPPAGWPRMSIVWPYWKAAAGNDDTFNRALDTMVRMNVRGVLLMGKDWGGSTTELPSNVVARLDQFIAAGITPYVTLWMAKFDSMDRTAAMAAWTAGAGRWGGAVLDVENGWIQEHAAHPGQTTTDLGTFITALRGAGCNKIALCSYGSASFFKGMDWPLWDTKVDAYFPQAYFSNPSDDYNHLLNRMRNQYADEGTTKPLIPMMNGYSDGADPAKRRPYIARSLDDYGGVSLWRYPVANSQIIDLFGEFPRDPASSNTYRIINTRLQLRAEAQGDPLWLGDTGYYWDTGVTPITADEKNAATIKRLYTGQALPAGNYTYRVEVQNTVAGWSAWSYGTLTLTQGYQPDSGAYQFLSSYGKQRLDRRVVIRDMAGNRGPRTVKAIIYDATNLGASVIANDIGEFYMTLPTTHPQASEIEPLQRHYTVEFYRAGYWRPVFEGIITDMDATDDEVVFYGLDYMGLLSKSIETAFYDWDAPEKDITEGGAKYIDKQISYIIKDQLQRGHDETNAPMGFIGVEGVGSNTLLEPINERVSIHAEFRERLSFILGLIQSAKQGTGKRSRLYVERLADGSYRWRYKNNAGIDRDNLRLKYGELVQGFRLVLLGDWAAKVYGVGRITNEIKLRFNAQSAPGIDTAVWGNVAMAAIWQDLIDENDLTRRVKQMSMEMGKFGKSVALGLRVSGLEPLDGYDLMDNIPVEIVRGAVDTTRYGSGYWTILGTEYRLSPDGHEELTLTIKPREDSTPPDPDLIPSHPISGGSEWSRLGLIGAGLAVDTQTSLRDDGTVTAQATVTTTPLAVDNYGYSVVQIALNNVPGTPDFTEAMTYQYVDPAVTVYDLLPGQDYSVRVGAYDTSGTFSGWSSPITFTAAGDADAPAVPTGLTVSPAIGGLSVVYDPVGAIDLDHYELGYKTGAGAEVFISTRTTHIALTGLLPNTSYQVRVRAVDTSGNASAYTSYASGTTALVQTADVGPLNASVIQTGVLKIGGTANPTLEVYNAAGTMIFRVDSNGILAVDPANTDRQMMFNNGTLTFTSDGWLTSGVAIDGDGIVATAITTGVSPGGHNMVPNSSFENIPFVAAATKIWTLAADWGTTIGTDVNVDKSTASLKLTTATY